MQNSLQYYKHFRNKKGIFISSIFFISFYWYSDNPRAGVSLKSEPVKGWVFAEELRTLAAASHFTERCRYWIKPAQKQTVLRLENILTSNYTLITNTKSIYVMQGKGLRKMTTAADAADISSLYCIA